ncbi:MAG: bifunctional methylenetetrahydrofolate dehydrogenase/methenyltetrahydrofolate cyclohydrolase FolD [Candidatus Syntrophonatronum acetioxidans]|uniref:Bifunctional protein FolD n=1 Tax=Candidatus Syntrophonatronum acetioxidans TaxID=1795816 RepID=A0A424YJ21_9FIRM|nr:MAG: bifunctional methylenetetrahydrofolate dehydrogenase/methenyltetrahydrofolate cyclohydrolase FolD [Candidatus Syntrophonatronum acetioxidans]
MTAKVISGKDVAAEIRADLKKKVEELKGKGIHPGLGVILVGDDPASVSYVTSKSQGCEEIGILDELIRVPADTSEEEVLNMVEKMNNDPKYSGILVQLPLPDHIDEEKIVNAIAPEKDVDGFHPVNQGLLLRGEPCPLPCTAYGVQKMLMVSGNDPAGKHVVICGRSNIVGKPLAAMMMQKAEGANATVTVVHTGTKDPASFTKQADILVAAMGKPEAITADMVKDGAVVIDVGVNRVDDPSKKKGFRLVGDVEYDPVAEKASYITPVPGGVGPMTVTMLLFNTVECAERIGEK